MRPLPKLPSLPKLPPLPALPKAERAIPEPVHEVTPAKGVDTQVGRWFEVEERDVDWGGRCCRCESLKPALKLRYAVGPFMRWEGWACETCRKGAKGLEGTPGGAKVSRLSEIRLSKPVPQSEKEKRYWAGVRKLEREELLVWEGEGGAAW
jgi:hypothetical protein